MLLTTISITISIVSLSATFTVYLFFRESESKFKKLIKLNNKMIDAVEESQNDISKIIDNNKELSDATEQILNMNLVYLEDLSVEIESQK